MKIRFTIILTVICIFLSGISRAQISGTVFRDFNGNGVKDNTGTFNEPFVQGIVVSVTLSDGTSYTTTTDGTGAFSFSNVQVPAGQAARVQFSGLATGDFPSFAGAGNNTAVSFVTAPDASVNFGINAPDDYWNNTTLTDPTLMVVNLRRGTTGSMFNGQYSLVQINNSSTGPYNPVDNNVITIDTSKRPAIHAQTGSLYGLAFQKKQQRVFSSAFLRRAVGLGPQGSGGVYIMDKSGSDWNLSGSFTLNGVTPANGGPALDFGTVTRVTAPANNDNYISNGDVWTLGGGSDTRDIDAFGKAGTMSFGDINAAPDNDTLFMVNLFQNRLIVFDASAATATLNNASAATLSAFTQAYTITSLPGCPAPTGAGNNIRAFAIKIYKGKGYLGVVSDGMSTQLKADLKGYILQFDPANIAAGFTTVVNIDFNTYNGTPFHPWVSTWAQAGGTTNSGPRDYPTPIISGIEFNEDGSMDIGIRDRWGDQGGEFEFNPVHNATGHRQCSINGDLLHACWVGNAWILEGTAGSCVQQIVDGAAANNNGGLGNSFNSTGKEWYADRSGDGGDEVNLGGLTKLMGTGKIISTVYDPMGSNETSGSNYWSTMGVQWNDVSTGVKSQVARVQGGGDNTLDKSNALGDVEVMSEFQPIQVGNRIWSDNNGDGIQDADEPSDVFNGTLVTLHSPGPDGIYGTGDDQTWTTTADAKGNYYFDNSNVISADTRKPATWVGVTGILPGYDYRIEIDVPAGYQLTTTNAGGDNYDDIDNDGVLDNSGTKVIFDFNTKVNKHCYDFGFKPLASVGNFVWRDDNGDGNQDPGEPGVSGVVVTLYDGTGTVKASTTTDAYGKYLFNNLAPDTYTVGFTLPPNYTFTNQTNTVDNADGTKPKATGSDVDPLTGRTYLITLVGGQNNPDVDAGLIFTTPATTAIVGDRVWLDADGDGIQGVGEPGVSGIVVTLYNSGVPVASTISDANGNYLFTNVLAGSGYTVGFGLPPGMVFTLNDQGGDDTIDSDVNPTVGTAGFGQTNSFTVVAGTTDLTHDAGIKPQLSTTASIGDFVWEDLNRDGLQDPGEPGIANVLVTLLDYTGNPILSGGNPVTTFTDAFGYYSFNNLTPGTYGVQFTAPAGYSFSPQFVGSNVAIDNNANPSTGKAPFLTVQAGDRISTIDAGMYNNGFTLGSTATLGDYLWRDDNNNGIQDAGEVGIAGVTVVLLDGTGNPVTIGGFPVTTTTDANGHYSFVNLVPGSYSVAFINLPQGFVFTQKDKGGDDTKDSDIDPATGISSVVTLSAGQNYTDLDGGLVQGTPSGKGSIGNKVWYDLNNDGIQDAGELGVAGVTVTLKSPGPDGVIGTGDDFVVGVTTTNSVGEYLFGGLPAGIYYVSFSNLPAGFTVSPQHVGTDGSVDSDGGALASGESITDAFSLATGEDNLTIDLGISQTGTNSLGDYVWFDANGDGIQDLTETGVRGVMVTLLDGSGNPVDGDLVTPGVQPVITTTDKNGLYLFAGLADGTYRVKFSNLPDGFAFTGKSVSNDGTGSDADLATGKTAGVVLNYAAGGTDRDNRSLDAGLISTRGVIGNFVWNDLNGNGIQDAGEPGISGVTVTLYAGDGVTVIATAITDKSGQYLFSNLSAGSYVLGFSTIPGNMVFTQQNNPGDNQDNTNSDANPSTGKTGVINIGAGETDLSIDAGLHVIVPASVGDFVWLDTNSDGKQSPGEPGIGGVIATLYDAANNPIGSAITDGKGYYSITNITPGAGYYVLFSNLPLTGVFTAQTSNVTLSDNSLGSDPNVATGQTASFALTSGEYLPTVDAGILWPTTHVLPVSLMLFTAEKTGTSSLLQWSTGQEINSDYIEIEHSSDGVHFTTLGRVNAYINSVIRRNYSFVDQHPFSGNNYYRLRFVSQDATEQYSNIRLVRFGKTGSILIYPNPVIAGQLNLLLPDSWMNSSIDLTLLNQAGQKLVTRHINNAQQTEIMDVTALPSGDYLLRIEGASNAMETIRVQVVKQ